MTIYNMNDTWNNLGTTFQGIRLNVTDTASAADSKLLQIFRNGTSEFAVTKGGAVSFAGAASFGTTITAEQDVFSAGWRSFVSRSFASTWLGLFTPTENAEYRIGDTRFLGSPGATDIDDLPGLIPLGPVTPNHWKENTTPRSTDMTEAIQAAHNYLANRGGGELVFLGQSYRISDTLVLPADGQVHWKSFGPAMNQGSGVACAEIFLNRADVIDHMINWSGAESVEEMADLGMTFSIVGMVITGGNRCNNLIYCPNTAALLLDRCRLLAYLQRCVYSPFNGTYTSFNLSGGLRVKSCNIGVGDGAIAFDLDAHTQDWFEGIWFSGVSTTAGYFKLTRSNKINIVNCEFNGLDNSGFLIQLNDDVGQLCSDIIFNENKVNINGSTGVLIDDNRTQSSSRRISFVGNNIIGGTTISPSTWNAPESNIVLCSQDTAAISWLGTARANGLTIDGAAATNREIKLTTAGEDRWRIRASDDAESGSEVGTDLEFVRFDDDGVFVSTAMVIKRSNGAFRQVDGAATASAGVATINANHGLLTTETLTTAAGAATQVSINNDRVTFNTRAFAQVRSYSGTGQPIVSEVLCATGLITLTIHNIGSASLNAAANIQFWIVGY